MVLLSTASQLCPFKQRLMMMWTTLISTPAMQVDPDETPPPNALLLLVSGDGIPLLVRSYGEVYMPPSAAVGVTSALYHAARREKDGFVDLQLMALETMHRSVVYEMTPIDLLLVFASDKPCDGCPSSRAIARRMLRTVFDSLLLLIGQQNLRDWDASKQRAAIAKQVDVVDTIVTKFQIDPRFVFGRPVRDVVAYRQLDGIDVGKSGSMLQGAWLENGELVGEYFQPNGPNMLEAKELLLLTVLGECVGGEIVITHTTSVAFTSHGPKRMPRWSFVTVQMVPWSPSLAFFLSRRRMTLRRQVAVVSSKSTRKGSWQSAGKSAQHLDLISRNFWWRELCRFAAHRQYATSSAMTLPSDYKHEDEHVRGPVQFLSLCIGPVPIARIAALGDALAEAMLNIQ
ncbi:hypothetical protein GQ600_22992 [Phytophthora cactorum]|nr:hypothetical protein GQ600_22992 [Phytophthora cactorum]